MITTTMVHLPNGGWATRKHAAEPRDIERLTREHGILEMIARPAVVTVLGFEAGKTGTRLLTAHAGLRELADLVPTDVPTTAAVIASLCQTVAELHEAGITHNRLTADHVVIADDGRPILCGFADAGLSPQRAAALPGAHRQFDPEGDVRALGTLALELLGRTTPAADRRSKRTELALSARFQTVAAIATTANGERTNAAQLAERFAALGKGAALPHVDRCLGSVTQRADQPDPVPSSATGPATIADPSSVGDAETRDFGPLPAAIVLPPTPRPLPLRRSAPVAAIAVLVVGALTGLGVVFAARSPESSAAPPAATPAKATPSTASRPAEAPTLVSPSTIPPTSIPPTTIPPTTIPPTTIPPTTTTRAVGPASPASCPTSHAEAARDGVARHCLADVVVAGHVVSLGALRWELGDENDVVSVGDLGCDGSLDVVLFRPRTAQLYRFDGWAPPGEDLAAVPLAVQADDVGTTIRWSEDGCSVTMVGPGEQVTA